MRACVRSCMCVVCVVIVVLFLVVFVFVSFSRLVAVLMYFIAIYVNFDNRKISLMPVKRQMK